MGAQVHYAEFCEHAGSLFERVKTTMDAHHHPLSPDALRSEGDGKSIAALNRPRHPEPVDADT